MAIVADAERVIVFGSYARGEATEQSDVYSIRLKPRVFSLIEYIFSHSDNTIFLNCLPRSS